MFVIYRNYVPLEVINYPKEFIFRIFSFVIMGDFLKGYLKGFCAKKAQVLSAKNKSCAVSPEFTLREFIILG